MTTSYPERRCSSLGCPRIKSHLSKISDTPPPQGGNIRRIVPQAQIKCRGIEHEQSRTGARLYRWRCGHQSQHAADAGKPRSEAHTSELQSLIRNSYAVFCLQKTKTTQHQH